MRRAGLFAAWLCAGCFNPDGGGGTTDGSTGGAVTTGGTATTEDAPTTRPTTSAAGTDTRGETASTACVDGCTSTTTVTTTDTDATTGSDGVFEVVLERVVTVNGPWGLAPADSNGDEFQDLYVASFKSEAMFVIDGATLGATPVLATGAARGLAAAQFDGLGGEDVVLAVQAPLAALVLLTATGLPDAPLVVDQSELLDGCGDAAAIAVTHLDDDGHPDVVVACAASSQVFVAAGNDLGTIDTPIAHAVMLSPVALALAEMVDPAGPDLVVAGTDALHVYAGTGAVMPAFAAMPAPLVNGVTAPRELTVGEVAGPADLDVIVTQLSPFMCTQVLGDGGGLAMPTALGCGAETRQAILVDVSADGFDDLVTIHGPSQSGTLAVALGVGDGTFQFNAYVGATGGDPLQVAAVDFSGDGVPDLAVSAFGGDAVYMYRVDP